MSRPFCRPSSRRSRLIVAWVTVNPAVARASTSSRWLAMGGRAGLDGSSAVAGACSSALLAPEEERHERLLHVQAVLGLVEHHRLRAVHDLVGDLSAPCGPAGSASRWRPGGPAPAARAST